MEAGALVGLIGFGVLLVILLQDKILIEETNLRDSARTVGNSQSGRRCYSVGFASLGNLGGCWAVGCKSSNNFSCVDGAIAVGESTRGGQSQSSE